MPPLDWARLAMPEAEADGLAVAGAWGLAEAGAEAVDVWAAPDCDDCDDWGDSGVARRSPSRG